MVCKTTIPQFKSGWLLDTNPALPRGFLLAARWARSPPKRPPGSPHDHFRDTNGGGIAFGENECPRWDLSFGGGDLVTLVEECVLAFYSEGPGGGHYEIMLDDYTRVGCGVYQEGSLVTVVQDYGY